MLIDEVGKVLEIIGLTERLGDTGDGVRRRNLSTVLTLVHRSRSLSRSQLVRETGLNRSTIAGLVGELAGLRLVHESEPTAPKSVGRPSPIVTTHEGPLALAVNPEIDAVTIDLIGLGGRVIAHSRYPTPSIPSVDQTIDLVMRAVAAVEMNTRHRLLGIGVAVPGVVQVEDGLVKLAPHLEWSEEAIGDRLFEATGLPTRVANDASLGCLAESRFGAGRGVANLVYLNGGPSGIGGGVVVRGEPLTGESGYAGELGHTLVRSQGERCHCGADGCLDAEVRRERLLELLGLEDADEDTLDAALSADRSPEVGAEVERQLSLLAVTITTAINIFNPSVVLLGGFLASLHRVVPGRLHELVARTSLRPPRERVVLRTTELGSDLLAIGAAELVFARILSDPATHVAAG